MTSKISFKDENTLEKRMQLSSKILKMHADRVPVIVERHPKSTTIPDIEKRKFLAPGDITVAGFISEIRKHIKIGADTTIFLFVDGNVLPPTGSQMSEVYTKHKDSDGFLYVVYSGESFFGSL
eukprot:TRINITY_DN2144_c0_g1_i2.p1 TRINITY_DN2144_c0_g1~~TRINITY_DN2144_c0_g1_i2.p1  ORF type:complete len:123 (+),score=22.72 TRINITY_DN2144_c0_g1_i2:40-408(+)